MRRLTKIVASAPGRCGIVGNPSDIYGGKVLSCSIPNRAVCTLTLGPDQTTYPDTALWDAVRKRVPLPPGWSFEWETTIPRSSGLSGSTALLAASLAACKLAAESDISLEGDLPPLSDKVAFAEFVRDVERYTAGIMCGYQDAYMIVHGGLNFMDFQGKHPERPGPNGKLRSITAKTLPFLLISTGVERLSGAVHGTMAQRWLSGEEEVRAAMVRLPQLAEAGATALESEDWPQLAQAMTENHRLIAELGGSGEAIERLIELCLRFGARAAKLAGAGLGGTVIALSEEPEHLERMLRQEGYNRFIIPTVQPGLTVDGYEEEPPKP